MELRRVYELFIDTLRSVGINSTDVFLSRRSGQYEIRKADDLPRGTKIVVHLKPEHREYADDDRIRNLIKKYSNFINFPILVNNEKCNVLQVSYVFTYCSLYVQFLPHKEVRFLYYSLYG